MRHFDEEVSQRLEDGITELEKRCLLEVVVRVTPRSDPYRDTALLWGLLGGLAALVVTLFAPQEVHTATVVPNAVVIGLIVGWLGRGRPGTRLLSTARRRHDRCLQMARACFVAESISGTKGRTGVLVYASALEDLVLVLPDLGAEGAAPEVEWEELRRLAAEPGRLPDRILRVLPALGELGARHLPAGEDDDNPDELSNKPIIG